MGKRFDRQNSLETKAPQQQRISSVRSSADVRALFVVAMVAMLCFPGRGQTSSDPLAKPASTIRVSSSFVILDALVENKKTGALVGDFQAADFRLFEDGTPQTITYFSQDRLPLSVLFLFDLTDTGPHSSRWLKVPRKCSGT